MNTPSIIVLCVLGIGLITAIVSVIKNKGSNCSSCPGNCSMCNKKRK